MKSPNPLGPLKRNILTGDEAIHRAGSSLQPTVGGFWSWAYSNLAANNLRGHFAEYLVATDIGADHAPRTEWDAYDVKSPTGVKIEVKSAAYLQSWEQTGLSKISFSIAPSQGWNDEINARSSEVKRQSDVYVFCLLHHKDKPTLDPTNVEQWSFYVLKTEYLDEAMPKQKTITLAALERLKPASCRYGEIAKTIELIMQPTT